MLPFLQIEHRNKVEENKAVSEMGRDFWKAQRYAAVRGFMGSIEEAGKVYKHCTGDNCTQLVLYQPTNSSSLLEDS